LKAGSLPARVRLAGEGDLRRFVEDFGELVTRCSERRIRLIEDASHAFPRPGAGAGQALGDTGDFVIASPCKLVSSFEGGLLHHVVDPFLRPAQCRQRA
jgi:dTDP-4-amino-4,6-dideoxygalactose transaminase